MGINRTVAGERREQTPRSVSNAGPLFAQPGEDRN
jgi:hypothetical protein